MQIVRTSDVLRQQADPRERRADITASDSLDELERHRARASINAGRYSVGRAAYQRMIAYDAAAYGDSTSDGPELQHRLEPYLQLADWDLLYSNNGAAFDQYTKLRQLIGSTRNAAPLLAAIFAPPMPIVLPAFLPNPLDTQESATYIDVTFEITKYGEARRIEVRGASPDVSNAAKSDLVTLLKSSRFRPRVTDGDLGRASPVAVRYYLSPVTTED
jgi:hypothetical protein